MWKIAETPKEHNKRKREEGNIAYWKDYVHTLFDRIWTYWDSDISRNQAYEMMAMDLKIPESQAHMSVMNLDQLKQAAEWAKKHTMKCIKDDEI